MCSCGGYLVPEEYDSRLIDGLTEENIMRRLGHRITTSGEHKINIAATKPAAAWIAVPVEEGVLLRVAQGLGELGDDVALQAEGVVVEQLLGDLHRHMELVGVQADLGEGGVPEGERAALNTS